MADGYVRQSSGLIVTEGTIEASHFNNEYNAIEDFADEVTGHNHDGTTGGGAPINLIANGTNNVTVEASTITMDIASTLVATIAAAGMTVVGSLTAGTTTIDTAFVDTVSEKTPAAGVTVDGVVIKDSGATFGGALQMADNLITRPRFVDAATFTTAVGNLGATQTFDHAVSNSYTGTVDQALVVTLSNPPASPGMGVFVLTLTNGGAFAITWPASVAWDTDGATAPTLQASGVDIIQLVTTDAGTTWRGVRIWKEA